MQLFGEKCFQGYGNIASGKWTDSNWFDETPNKNVPLLNHSLNVSGGTEQSAYSIGLSLNNEEGIVAKPAVRKTNRYTFLVNTVTILAKGKGFDILKIGENLNFSNSTSCSGFNTNTSNQSSFADMMSSPLLFRSIIQTRQAPVYTLVITHTINTEDLPVSLLQAPIHWNT